MISLPEARFSADEQLALAWPISNITTARSLLRLHPTNLALWRAVVVGLAAERLLWESNLRLVMRIALDLHRRGQGEVDDLFQEGALALRECLRTFRPELGYRLSTYAHDVIRRRMLSSVDQGPWLPGTQRIRRRALRAHEDVAQELHHPALARRVSADILDHMACDADHFGEVESGCLDFLDLIANPYRELLVLRYGLEGEPLSQREAALHFGVSTSTISRWERTALDQARTLLAADTTMVSAARSPQLSDPAQVQRRHRSSSGLPSRSRIPRHRAPWR